MTGVLYGGVQGWVSWKAYYYNYYIPRRTEALSVVPQKVLLGFVSEESITPIRESEKDRRSTGILCLKQQQRVLNSSIQDKR